MGCGPFSRYKNCSCVTNPEVKAPNPDPEKFEIIKTKQIGMHLVAKINYPNCTNYEGNKICVFLDTTDFQLRHRRSIDPHFAENDEAPFARFAPTPIGWVAAEELAYIMSIEGKRE